MTQLSDSTKGILLFIGGTILLLNTLGIIEKGLDTLIIIGSVAMIVAGLIMSNVYEMVMNLINKKE